VSGDEAADDAEDLEHVSFILMRADNAFDGQERVMSRAAWDLQCRATAHSVFRGHPGFVPDEYLAALSTDTTITAAELCTAGMWERVGDGYRVLDQESVEVCLDRVRQIRGEDAQALAWESKRQAQDEPVRAMVVAPPCAACGSPSARIELVAPGELPAEWEHWRSTSQGTFLLHREPGQWHLIFTGVATGNGHGHTIDARTAEQIARAFRLPLTFAQVHTAGFYDDAGFCQDCDAPYCYQHWQVSESGHGSCPRGHGKSLDPH
jgi:hypothetical protein